MAEWWSGSDVILYIDKKDYDKYYGNEHGYLLMNHSYETDWLIGWLFCDRIKVLGVIILYLFYTYIQNYSKHNYCLHYICM